MRELISKAEGLKVFRSNEDCAHGRAITKVNLSSMLAVVTSYIKYISKTRIYHFHNMLWIISVLVIDILRIKV